MFSNYLFGRALDEEFERMGQPGSRWNDVERDKWRQEVVEATAESASREFIEPAEAVAWADETIQREKRDKSALEEALDREFEQMAQHDSRAEHRIAMRDRSAEEFERTHDSAGRETGNRAQELWERGR
jgi:hypothetical protein